MGSNDSRDVINSRDANNNRGTNERRDVNNAGTPAKARTTETLEIRSRDMSMQLGVGTAVTSEVTTAGNPGTSTAVSTSAKEGSTTAQETNWKVRGRQQ
jgi:hypothetical protein